MVALKSIFAESHGYKRALSILFFLISSAGGTVPALLPYQPLLEAIGSVLGVWGIGAAAVRKGK
jgi:hypothetical protein